MARLGRAGAAGLATLLALGTGRLGQAQDPGGPGPEGRSLLRDLDAPMTVIAGEADGAATVMNPAGLGLLGGVSGVIAAALSDPAGGRRGAGAGAFVGAPIGGRIFGRRGAPLFAVGAAYQWLRSGPVGALGPALVGMERPFHKVTLALAVPLIRWAPGLSVGLAYSRLGSVQNPYADGLDAVDVGVSYRLHRAIALGVVGRGLNLPRAGPALGSGRPLFQPLEIDPEVALRPIRGRSALEIGLGGRIAAVSPDVVAARPLVWQPRARIRAGRRGLALFGEVEAIRAVTAVAEAGAMTAARLRWSAGLSLDFGHVGAAAAVTGGAGADGAALRLRASEERYEGATLRPRAVARIALAGARGDRGVLGVIAGIDGLPAGAAALIDLSGARLGWAQAEEVREAIARRQAGGAPVVVYLRGGGLKSYYIASAADHVIAHPQSRLAIVGARVEVFYFAELLGRLGARAEFLRIAEFKARPEQAERGSASEPVAEQRALLLEDLRATVVGGIAAGRGVSAARVAAWIDAAPLGPEEALRAGAVDALAWPDEVEAAVGRYLGRVAALREAGERPAHDGELGPGPAIAVIHVEGVLVEGESAEVPLLGQRLAGARALGRAIAAAREDRRVRALVVRIDSVGGSVAAAAAITRELELAAAVKPVVVSMGDVAASGGYYIATAGQVIFADALTSTGSIGVFRAKIDLSGLLARLGIAVEGAGFGAAAGIGSWWKPYSPAERAAALRGLEASYAIFTARVGRARGLDAAAVDAVARGRVWGGARARGLGLVDEDGGLFEAVARARALAGLDARAAVIHAPSPPGVLGSLKVLGGMKLPFGIGNGTSSEGEATPIAGPLGEALRRLPVGLWLVGGDEELAMASEAVEIAP